MEKKFIIEATFDEVNTILTSLKFERIRNAYDADAIELIDDAMRAVGAFVPKDIWERRTR